MIVVVFDNQRYGTIRMWQDRRGRGEGVATELGPIDFAAIARALRRPRRPVERRRRRSSRPSARRSSPNGRRSSSVALDQAWVSVGDRPRALSRRRQPARLATHRERQRNAAALLGADVGVAAPPVDGCSVDAFEPKPGAERAR